MLELSSLTFQDLLSPSPHGASSQPRQRDRPRRCRDRAASRGPGAGLAHAAAGRRCSAHASWPRRPLPRRAAMAGEEELPDFDEEERAEAKEEPKEGDDGKKKGGFATIHSSGFRDFLLKAELMRAIVDCGFEHPSEVQHECIPQAILGTDILCQAKSGMGKTAVFVLACLQQIDTS
ncbi:unnamed protein product, partial [Prorocentrum cordatum]